MNEKSKKNAKELKRKWKKFLKGQEQKNVEQREPEKVRKGNQDLSKVEPIADRYGRVG
jgi:hypothetical protein